MCESGQGHIWTVMVVRHIRSAVLGPPFLKRCRANPQLMTNIWNADTHLETHNEIYNKYA
jgi:hypothetical protein